MCVFVCVRVCDLGLCVYPKYDWWHLSRYVIAAMCTCLWTVNSVCPLPLFTLNPPSNPFRLPVAHTFHFFTGVSSVLTLCCPRHVACEARRRQLVYDGNRAGRKRDEGGWGGSVCRCQRRIPRDRVLVMWGLRDLDNYLTYFLCHYQILTASKARWNHK